MEVLIVRRLFGASAEALIIVILVSGLLAIPVLAAKGGGGGGAKPGGGGSGGTISLVMVDPADTTVNHGDHVTFSVATTATDRPFVKVNCYQNGVWVYAASAGFFPDYPWSRNFILAADSWPGGAASCTATLYSSKDGIRTTTLATLNFAVAA
jgi:hypothetical protein